MSDEPSDCSGIESELRQFHSAVPAGSLERRLAAALDAAPARPWADRCLMGAIGLGVAAAIAVVTMVGPDLMRAQRDESRAGVPAEAAAAQTRAYLAQLALGGELPAPPAASQR